MAETLTPKSTPDYWQEESHAAQEREQAEIEKSVADQQASEHWRPKKGEGSTPEPGPDDHWAPQAASSTEEVVVTEPGPDDHWAIKPADLEEEHQAGIEASVAEGEAEEFFRPDHVRRSAVARAAEARAREVEAKEARVQRYKRSS
jgi:hypothetical protein